MEYALDNPEIDIIHTNERWVRNGQHLNQHKKHRKEGGDIFERSLQLCLISPSSVMIRRSLFERVGLFDPLMTVCEDYDLWLRITSTNQVGFIEEVLIIKRGGHQDQLSHRFVAMDYWRVLAIDKLLRQGQLSDQQSQVAVRVLLKKCEILLKGYKKHNNMEHFPEVEEILQRYK
jgi:GT2 family glycosyltransferase